MARPRRRRRLLLAVALVVAVAVVVPAAWGVGWYWVSGEVRAAVDDWAAERRAGGWTVDLGTVTTGGFPFRLTMRSDGIRLAGPGNGWRWHTPGVIARARLSDPERIAVVAPGVHAFRHDGRNWRLEAAGVDAVVTLDDGELRTIRLDLAAPLLRNPQARTYSAESAEARVSLSSGKAAAETVTYDFAVALKTLKLPPIRGLPRTLGTASAEGSVRDLPTGPGETAEILEKWRKAGGVVQIRSLVLDGRGLKATADGTLALDRRLQPEGAMTVRLAGFRRTVDRLRDAGAISVGAALAIGVAGLALTTDDGRVRLPVTLQAQRLKIGPVNVTKLDTIRW